MVIVDRAALQVAGNMTGSSAHVALVERHPFLGHEDSGWVETKRAARRRRVPYAASCSGRRPGSMPSIARSARRGTPRAPTRPSRAPAARRGRTTGWFSS